MATKLDELFIELRARDAGLQSSLTGLEKRLDSLDKTSAQSLGNLDRSLNRVRNSVLSMATAWGAWRVGRGIVEAGMQVEAMRNRMAAATGDARIAAESLQYVRSEADRLGIDVRAAAEGFSSFAASALRSGLTFQQTQDIFTGVSEAVVAMRLSTEKTQLVFMALSQMASKNAVTMEDLKQQLGEHLPGALQIFSKAMGKTNAEFIKMIENGQVTGADLVKLGQGLRKDFGQAAVEASNSAQAAFNRMGNAFFELQSKMAESGFLDAVTNAVREMTDVMNDPETVNGLKGFASMLGDIITMATRAASAIGNFYTTAQQRKEDIARWDGTTDLQTHLENSAHTRSLRERVLADYIAKQKAMAGQGGGSSPSSSYTLGTPSSPSTSTPSSTNRAADQAARLREQLAGQVESMRYQFASPEQRASMDVEEQLDTLKEALEAKAITEQEYRDLNLKAEMEYQAELERIRQEALEKDLSGFEAFIGVRVKSQQELGRATLQEQASSFAQSIALGAKHNQLFFQLEKARALAAALIQARESVIMAYNFGLRISGGNPAVGAAIAGVAAAAQAANIAAIASTSYNSKGSSIGSSGSGGSSISSSGDEGGGFSSPAPPKSVYITLNGDDSALFSKNTVRKLLDSINDAIGDGSQLKVVVAS